MPTGTQAMQDEQSRQDRTRRIEELFDAALEVEPARRATFLQRACAGDAPLRAELDSLLAADASSAGFLERPAIEDSTMFPAHLQVGYAPEPGSRLGAYEIVRPIASGGMGTVYEAVQEQPRRSVALKVLRTDLASTSARRRFQFESELLGRLSHPGIAGVYEAGVCEEGPVPFPFFAMEFVPGARAITDYARENALGARARLELFASVCDAVQHGHQRGVIHRDLKPANILVSSAGELKVIDFGIARASGAEREVTGLQTAAGQLLGTLQYMSPEQCDGDPRDLDTCSDVYALGLLLYELLCDERPYDLAGCSLAEALAMIKEREPGRPSDVRRELRGDLDTIVLKALEKDRSRRYTTAAELAHDVRLHLSGDPIQARRRSGWYVLGRTVRRHKLPVAAALLLAGVVVAALFVSLHYWRDAIDQRDRAIRAEGLAGDRLAELEATHAEVSREAQKHRRTSNFLAQIISGVRPDVAQGKDTTLLREIFDEAAARAETELQDAPEIQAAMRDAIGRSYRGLGMPELAERELSLARATYRELYGDERSETIGVTLALGRVYHDLFRLAQAEALIREVLVVVERMSAGGRATELGAGQRPADLLNDLATILAEGGRLEQAEELFRQALARANATAPQGQTALSTATNLAGLLRVLQRWNEADELYATTLAECRRTRGPRDKLTLQLMEGWIEALVALGRLEDAEHLAAETLDLHVDVYGEGHVKTLRAMNSMAGVLESLNRWEEEGELREQILELAREALPAGHFLRAQFQDFLGHSLMRLRRFDEAERHLRAAYDKLEASVGREHHAVRDVLQHLVWLYESRGEPEKAAEFRARM